MSKTSDRPSAQRRCELCGKMFTPKQDFHRTCFDCFKGQRGQSSGGREKRRQNPADARLPDGYLSQGYFDKEGNLFRALVNELPEQIAKSLGVGGVTSTQLRRFFNKAKMAEQRLDAGESFDSVVPTVLELKQHVANSAGRAKGRNEQAGLELLKQFIDKNVDAAAGNETAFRKGFLLHFQGVVAYFKYHNPKK